MFWIRRMMNHRNWKRQLHWRTLTQSPQRVFPSKADIEFTCGGIESSRRVGLNTFSRNRAEPLHWLNALTGRNSFDTINVRKLLAKAYWMDSMRDKWIPREWAQFVTSNFKEKHKLCWSHCFRAAAEAYAWIFIKFHSLFRHYNLFVELLRFMSIFHCSAPFYSLLDLLLRFQPDVKLLPTMSSNARLLQKATKAMGLLYANNHWNS